MKKSGSIALIIFVTLLFAASTFAQKWPPGQYTITAINVTPFNEQNGKFDEMMAADDTGGFGNDLSKSLLVVIEINGPKGEFFAGRKVNIRVTEGKKVKLTRIGYPGVMGDDGKYFVPVWLYGSMCDDIKITATMIGQRMPSSKTRTINFHCGE